jgi:hypothetical protein
VQALEVLGLINKRRVEGLLLQGVHRVEEIKYPEVFDRLSQGVRAGVLVRLEVTGGSSGGLTPLKYSKEDEGRSHPAEVKFRRKNFGSFRKKLSRRNERSKFSQENFRSHEDREIQRNCKVDKGGQTHQLVSGINVDH